MTACRPHSPRVSRSATIDEACAAGTLLVLAPDLKEELPVLYLRVRDAVEKHRLRVDRALTDRDVAHAPGGCVAALPTGRASRARRVTARQGSAARRRQARLALAVHRRRRHRRPTVGRRGGRRDRGGDRRDRHSPTRCPLPRRGAARQRAGRDRHGPRAGPAPGTSRARRRSRVVHRAVGRGAVCFGSRHRRDPAAPRPMVASAASCCSVPIRSPTSPIAASPSRRSMARPG